MVKQIVWNGTHEESMELLHAISRNCACKMGDSGERIETCASHMLTTSQRSLDGLLFARRLADRLRREEFGGTVRLTR